MLHHLDPAAPCIQVECATNVAFGYIISLKWKKNLTIPTAVANFTDLRICRNAVRWNPSYGGAWTLQVWLVDDAVVELDSLLIACPASVVVFVFYLSCR